MSPAVGPNNSPNNESHMASTVQNMGSLMHAIRDWAMRAWYAPAYPGWRRALVLTADGNAAIVYGDGALTPTTSWRYFGDGDMDDEQVTSYKVRP